MPARAASTIHTVLVDDEQLACDELFYMLKQFPDIEVLATGHNGLEAVDLVEELEPDLVFLDVQMPGLDGMSVIRKLQQTRSSLPYFVLVTAFDSYAVEAFRVDALDYLLKPLNKDRLAETLERARRAMTEKLALVDEAPASPGPRPALQRNKVLVKSGNRNFIVDAQDIIYATIEDGLITVSTTHLEGQSNYRTIEELQSNLDPDLFWRAHRSYLVNINRIREVVPWFKSSYQLRMDDKKGTEIPVSRVQTKRLRMLLKL
ncbi:MAG: response regulator transcription factor [Acidobacteria bacterium]|nr:response regulator transcription factor [Acidobacteriota bacterium]